MSGFDTSATAPPRSVLWSSRLYIVGAVLGLVGIVLTLVLLPATIDATVQAAIEGAAGQDVEGVDIEAIARGAAIGGAVLGVLAAVLLSVLTVLFARKMRQGRNWARIVLLVFAILQVTGVLSAFGIGALQFVVLVVAAVLSFRPASNAWFRSVKATAPLA